VLTFKVLEQIYSLYTALAPWLGLPVTMMVKMLTMVISCRDYYLPELNITDVLPAVDDETELNSAIFTQNE